MHLECVDIVAIYARIESCVHVVITEHSTSTIATTPHPKTAIPVAEWCASFAASFQA